MLAVVCSLFVVRCFPILSHLVITTKPKNTSSSMKLAQGAILIVDKSIGVQCRAASAAACEQYERMFGAPDSNALSSDRRPSKRTRRKSQQIKRGHAGTLDPMATGCLPVLLGQATKLQDHLPIERKRYVAMLRLGIKTDTDDADGEVVSRDERFTGLEDAWSDDRLNTQLGGQFCGEITQVPPIYSAIHINGKRAYDMARAGEKPEIPPRQVQIYQLNLSKLDPQTIRLDVTCGTGTYIRTLGVDIARALGTQGHLIALRRVSSGPFAVPVQPRPRCDQVEITRVVSFRQAIESFAMVLDISANVNAQVNLKQGRFSMLYRDLTSMFPGRLDFAEPVKIALEWAGCIQALIRFDHSASNVSSICHFAQHDDLIPFLPPLVHRDTVALDTPAGQHAFRIAQFNVLANALSFDDAEHRGGFDPIATPWACLHPEYRKDKIMEEILRFNPDLIGMQEVDAFLPSSIFSEQYSSSFIPKNKPPRSPTSPSVDGCMILYRKDRYELVKDYSFIIDNEHSQVCAALHLFDKLSHNNVLMCTTHLKAEKSEQGETIRAQQIGAVCARIAGLAKDISPASPPLVFLTADLNATPQGRAYQVACASGMKSYFASNEPEFTTVKKRSEMTKLTIDYVLYSPHPQLARGPSFLSFPSMDECGLLPNWSYPSDHLMLGVSFQLVEPTSSYPKN